jgi:hypothetical protein
MKEETLTFPTGDCTVYRNQIVIWISILKIKQQYNALRRPPYFPVLLDTGFNHNIHISKQHFNKWTKDTYLLYPEEGVATLAGVDIPLRKANILIYRNIPGLVYPDLHSEPIFLELNAGIIINENDSIIPRIPLIGMRALKTAGFDIRMDCAVGLATIAAPDPDSHS